MNIFNKELKLTNELKTDFLRIFYYDFEENYKENGYMCSASGICCGSIVIRYNFLLAVFAAEGTGIIAATK